MDFFVFRVILLLVVYQVLRGVVYNFQQQKKVFVFLREKKNVIQKEPLG